MLKNLIASVMLGINSYTAIEMDKPEGDNYTVTVCHVIEDSTYEEYTPCENWRDVEDVLWLDGVWDTGDVLKVTFKDDDPETIEKVN